MKRFDLLNRRFCDSTELKVIGFGIAAVRRMTCWIGGDSIETSVTFNIGTAFITMTCCIRGEVIEVLMIGNEG